VNLIPELRMCYKDRFTFWQACIKLKSVQRKEMPTQPTSTHTHLKKNLPYLIIRQVLSIPSCIGKIEESKTTKAKPCIKVIGGPSPITRREEAMVEGEKIWGKKSFLQSIEVFYFIPIEKHGQNNHFLAFTRTNIATPAIMPPNTNNTKIGNPPEEVSRPWGATVDMNANSVLPIF
jgi:hypothetical protein